ncbi:hypothetical protein EAF00_011547 [Botryotinia globosa]|nr:hypothetical protein EAF00_011547 [Botryotinia globosa]
MQTNHKRHKNFRSRHGGGRLSGYHYIQPNARTNAYGAVERLGSKARTSNTRGEKRTRLEADDNSEEIK